LSQPLGAILRNAEAAEIFLQDPSPDLEELRAIVKDIREDDQRAGAVIDRMRSMAKRREIVTSRFDPNLLVEDTIRLVGPSADSSKIRVLFAPDGSLPKVLADRVQLQQVLLNLLLNAKQSIDGVKPANAQIIVRLRMAGRQIEFAVSDCGPGIPIDKLPRLFEPFFTTKPDGLGLGLAISRNIIETHGGHIRAENNSNGGATFYFTLPVKADAGVQ
jgi:two-component system sensor kinase FixL